MDQPDVLIGRRELVGRDTAIATIGSCFAERVVEVLDARGFRTTFHPGGLQYNTFSLAQEFDHLFGPDDPYSDDDFVLGVDGNWEHLFRKALRGPDREQLLADQTELDEEARSAYREAELIVVTLGLTEVWERCSDGLVAVGLPPQPTQSEGLFRFRNSSVEENVQNLERIQARLAEVSDAQLLLTVSPVPLSATFRDMDIIVANCESKSRLRAAVADFRELHPEVSYFHSYELVSHWQGDGGFFLEDGRHVSPAGVAFIMNEFLRMFGRSEVRPEFVPLGEVAMPDQTGARRWKQLKGRVASGVRRFKGLEG
jgi:hypothetical protein